MDTTQAAQRIEALSREIEHSPGNRALYMERGRIYHKTGEFHRALNDFLRAREIGGPDPETDGYIAMLREIFAFRYGEIYNP